MLRNLFCLTLPALLVLGGTSGFAGNCEWEFNNTDAAAGWQWDGLINNGISNGAVQLSATRGNPFIFTPKLEIDAGNYGFVTFRMRLGKDLLAKGCILFITEEYPQWNDRTIVSFDCQSDGEMHDYEVDMSKNPLWKGTVTQLRFQPFYVQWPLPEAQRTMEIGSFRVINPSETANLISNGGLEELDEKGYPRGWRKLVEAPLPIDAGELKMRGNPVNSLVSPDAHTGKNALVVKIPEGKTEIGGWETRAPVKPKTLYRLTFWAKATGNPYALVAINEFKDNGVRTAHYEGVVKSDRWEKYTVDFEANAESKGVQIHACIWGGVGQAWFDDFVLEEMDVSNVSAAAATPGDSTPYDVLTRAVVTPHIAWAVPYLNGPIKVLAIPKHREVVELAQRLDLDYTTWSQFNSGEATFEFLYTLYYGTTAKSILSSYKELKTKLQKEYDVILFGATSAAYKPLEWGNLTKGYRQSIMDKVKQGAGLILVRPTAETMKELAALMDGPVEISAAISAGMPYAGLTVLDKDSRRKDWLQAFKYGRGRVVFVDYQNECFGYFEGEKSFRQYWGNPFTPVVSSDYRAKPLYYDYYLSLLSHLVVWAAGKEGPVSITKLAFEKNTLTVGINNTGAPGEKTIELVVRDPDNQREMDSHQKFSATQGEGSFSLNIPSLKSGGHFADVWLKNNEGKTITWGSAYFQTEAPINITAIETDQSFYRPGDTIEGTLVLDQALPAGMKVQLQVSDSLGRLLCDRELTASDGKNIPFQFTFSSPAAILHRIRARVLTDKNAVISEKTAEVIVRKPTNAIDDFKVSFWGGGAIGIDGGSKYMLEDFYQRGFDNAYIGYMYAMKADQSRPMLLNTVRHNLDLGLFAFNLACWNAGSDPTQTISPRCLTAPAFRENMFAVLKQHSAVAKDFPTYFYSLGDETGICGYGQDYCFSPTCMAYLRNFLKSEYGSLENLNREWGTQFSDWASVKPMTKAEAKAHGNFAPWVDHRRSMEAMFAGLLAESAEAIHQQDPGARVGEEGIQPSTGESSTMGYDFGKIIPAGNYWTVYFHYYPQIEFLRSFAAPDSFLGIYTQPFEDKDRYYGSTRQFDAVNRFVPWYGLFHGMNSVTYWGLAGTTWYGVYHPDYTPAPWLKPIEETIREIKGGIGKLVMNCRRENYGIAIHYSQASLHVATIMGAKERVGSLHSFPLLLEDIGLQYDMLSQEQMAGGKLDNYKVLVLPFSYAISTEEQKAIAAFAARGGIIIADGTPGITDGHGKNAATNMLAGIKMHTMQNPVPEYDRMRVSGEGNAQRVELQQVLEKAGVSPRFKVTSKNNSMPVGYEVVSLRDKAAEYLGILQGREFIKKAGDDHTPEPVKITLDKKYHVYAVREGRYFGFIDKIDAVLEPAVAQLYALLPAKVAEVQIVGLRKSYDCGEEVKFQVRAKVKPDVATPHVFHLEVRTPQGSIHREYTRNIYAPPNAAGEACFRFALNDRPGKWRIRVTDAASGRKAGQTIVVKQAQSPLAAKKGA